MSADMLTSNRSDTEILCYGGKKYFKGNLTMSDNGTIVDLVLNENGTDFNAYYEYVAPKEG